MSTKLANAPANVLNNAVVVRTTKYDPQKFTDLNSLYANYSKDSLTVYKGLLALWNQRGIINTPLLNLTELRNSVMYLPNTAGRFRYSIPYNLGLPYIMENLESDNPNAGRDGQKFKIKLNSNCFSNTDILGVDKIDGMYVYVTDDEIYEEGEGWVYTVEIVSSNRRNLAYPQHYMQPGVQYMKIENANGEYDTQMSGITTTSGTMDLEMELGGGHRSVTHWVTGYAAMAKIDESKDPRLAYINSRISEANNVTLYYNQDAKGKPIKGSMSWHSTLELLLRAEMEKMTENGLMWGKGGYVSGGQGRTKVKVASGLYEQLRNGNYIKYNRMSLEFIEHQVANLFHNTGIPIEQRHTKIQTGQGGLTQISKDLNEKFKQVIPNLIQAKDVPGGIFYGNDPLNVGFKEPRFTKFFSPIAGYIEFEHNTALDYVSGSREQDAFNSGLPNSSFTYMIMDITDKSSTNATARINTEYRVENGFNSGSNIVLVKPQDYGDLYWGYINGTHSPFGPSGMKGMNSANAYNGYQIWMKSFGTIWVKDVTRTLLLERARPGHPLH